MKTLHIPLRSFTEHQTLDEISNLLDELQHHKLDYDLWVQSGIKPAVSFTLAHNHNHLFLKFYVKEPQIKAVFRNINDPVYRDSCVELFIAFGKDINYYNLEFNCEGTCLGQYGKNKQDRQFIAPEILQEIKTETCIRGMNEQNLYTWELAIKIPFRVFNQPLGLNVHESNLRLNLYKCGDDLEAPHFMAWNNIVSTEPNFHLPEFFGAATFGLMGTSFEN